MDIYRVQALPTLVLAGWREVKGVLVHNDHEGYVPSMLMDYLGQSRLMTKLPSGNYVDVHTGYVWPAAVVVAVESTKTNKCECGANYTSAPNVEHTDWCPVSNKLTKDK